MLSQKDPKFNNNQLFGTLIILRKKWIKMLCAVSSTINLIFVETEILLKVKAIKKLYQAQRKKQNTIIGYKMEIFATKTTKILIKIKFNNKKIKII